MAVDRPRVEALVRELLEAIGEDPDRLGLQDTPTRVADAYTEFFSGVGEDAGAPLDRTISVSGLAGGSGPDFGDGDGDVLPTGAVILRDVFFRSVCEHHLLPFIGTAHIAYLPGEQVVGLGALPRVLAVLASRPQVQERLGEQVVDVISSRIDARGVLVVLDAVHGCVTSRGERQPVASTVTIAARGDLAEPAARSELIALMTGRS